ncbi:MAG: glycosyl transferase family 2, partial [Mucilaginibacter sp.]|nr:glycosyl transferase family 2 [Mucilaginibacter sp.]
MVSIILPNLNTPLEFLEPRINSILDQSYTNWECIIIDGFSSNGSWEMLHEKAASDRRFFYHQKPARGIYDAWNEGIKLTKGEYIYIATSDDLFTPDFLDKMVNVLEANPDCSIAHCCLNIIDEGGEPTESQWHDWEKVKFYGDHIYQYHKRMAPYDAIVHFGWSTVYTSIVQLLIRKDLFEQVGFFSH